MHFLLNRQLLLSLRCYCFSSSTLNVHSKNMIQKSWFICTVAACAMQTALPVWFFYHKLNFSVLIKVLAHVDPFKMKRNLVCKSHR